jgi:hypothetical protein
MTISDRPRGQHAGDAENSTAPMGDIQVPQHLQDRRRLLSVERSKIQFGASQPDRSMSRRLNG